MKLLGIDYGLRRIGVSASDPLGIVVRAVKTIDRKTEKTMDELRRIVEEESPEKIIFGLPLGHDDEETEMCQKVRNFVDRFYNELKIDIPHDFQDESYSSVRTHNLLRQTSKKKKRSQKKTIDKIAACIILEDYIRESSGSYLLY